MNNLERVHVRVTPDGRVNRRDAALYLGCEKKTLTMWKSQGKGPRSVKVGGRDFYFVDDLDAFIRDGRATQSDEAPEAA
jgi:hypothetical protein